MEKALIYIKHHFGFLWAIIEWTNGTLFSIFFRKRLRTILPSVLNEFSTDKIHCRQLFPSDGDMLINLLNSQDKSDLKYFNAHPFAHESVKRQFRKPSFLMMGSFESGVMTGYFFLRFFVNRKCFVGRLIDRQYRGRGIGLVMNSIMYETAWRMNFKCLSTISRNNKLVMKAHARNKSMKVMKELGNDYLLVEFVKPPEVTERKV